MRSSRLKDVAVGAALGLVLVGTGAYAAGKKWPWHPVLKKAENQLTRAKATLESASHDCGGHRMAAIKAIEQAIQEVQQGREYANAHPEEAKKQ